MADQVPGPHDLRVTVVPHPAAVAAAHVAVPAGLTIREIVDLVVPDPVYRELVVAFARGRVLPYERWPLVRPFEGELLELRVVPAGQGKSPLRIALTLGVVVAAIAAPYALPAGVAGTALIGTGATAITVGGALSSAIAIGGMLAVNALVPIRPPSLGALSKADGSPTLFIEGARNAARPFSPVPVVLGRYRMTPPYGAQPITETVGTDQYLRMLFVWGVGPIHIETDSLRIGDTPLSSFEGVETEHREGFPNDPPITLYGAGGGLGSGGETVFQENLAATLPDGTARIRHFGTVPAFTGAALAPFFADSNYWFVNPHSGSSPYTNFISELPAWTTRTSQDDADELSVDYTFPEGLYRLDSSGKLDSVLILLEIQFRRIGGDPVYGDNWLGITFRANGSVGEAPLHVTQAGGAVYFDTERAEIFSDYKGFNFTDGVTTGGHFPAAIATKMQTTALPLVVGTPIGLLFEAKEQQAIRHGIRWRVPTRGQYEIRMRKITRFFDHPGTVRKETVVWTALRTIRAGDPIQLGVGTQVPVARTALRIKATGQLNGVIDELSGVVESYAPIWTGTSWTDGSVFEWRPTNNPASLFRLVLQGNGSANPLPNDRLDLDAIAEWYEFCEDHDLHFNMVRDFSSSVWETLLDVAAAGRAAPCQVDGKWSVVIEREQPFAVSHVTPRNSFDFRAERVYLEQPHAWRIRFPNEEEDYRQDERRVYAEGFSAANATRFEALELPGVTLPSQIGALGAFRIAQGRAQIERWEFRQDMEFLTYRRGDRIAITHDVLQVGLGFGRVVDTALDSVLDVDGVELDEAVTMVAGNLYGITIRTANGSVTRQVVNEEATVTFVTFFDDVPNVGGEPAIAVGDLFGFGILGEETDDATVISIAPDPDFTARIVCVPYRPAIFAADLGAIPEFETTLSPLPVIPAPTVRGVQAGQDLLVRGTAAEVRARIAIDFDPLDTGVFGVGSTVEVQGRPSSLPQQYAGLAEDSQTASRVLVSGVTAGDTWDLRLRFHVAGRLLPGPWAYVNNVAVLDDAIVPGDLTGLTISAIGGFAYLRWDPPSELDRLLDHGVAFRHSLAFLDESPGPSWDASSPIGSGGTRLNDRLAVLPLVAGTYLARVFSRRGVPSAGVAEVDTRQVSVLTYTTIASIDEAPDFGGATDGFAGASSGVFATTDTLRLEESTDAVEDAGTYYFENRFDFGTPISVRLITRLAAASVLVFDRMDARTLPVDLWEDWDGTNQSAASAHVEVRYTNDDPDVSGASWSAWERLDAAEFAGRGFEFRAILATVDPAYNVEVTELGVDAAQVT